MNTFAVHYIACFILSTYLLGATFTLIVCELYDSERRRKARMSGLLIEPMSFSMKLRFSLLWPYYFLLP